MNGGDVTTPDAPTGAVAENVGGSRQPVPSGPYARNSTVEPATGSRRPATVAVAVTWPPTMTPGDAATPIDGVASGGGGGGGIGGMTTGGLTTTVSPGSPQPPLAGRLFASPL